MQNQNRSRTLIIIGGIWLALLLFNFLSTNAAVKTIPYSEFLQLAKEGKVSEVAVSDNVIQGKMFTDNSDSEQGEPFQTVRVDGEISDVLEQNGIEYAGKIQSNFLSNLLSWILPVLLFLGLWFLIMRRFQKQQGGFMTLGKNKAVVGMAEFEEAVERVVAGLEKKNRLINPKEKKIVAYHELGHAIVAMTLPETDPVQKISIIPRGIAALGYTMQVPTEDRFLMRRTELLNRIATLLGGRAAEDIVFDDISTGAHNDLSRATDIARSMVKEYGMSRQLGQVHFSRNKQNPFLNANPDSGGDYSEMTAHLIDEEIRQIIDEQYERVLGILKSRRDILDEAAKKLLESEVIEGEELKALADAVSQSGRSEDDTKNSQNSPALAA